MPLLLRAFDRREARQQVERPGDLDGSVRGRIEPFSDSRCTGCGARVAAEALLDRANHHGADHLAGDVGGCRHPADNFAVVAIEGDRELVRPLHSSR